VDSANWEKSLWPSSPMPAQETILLAKKGGDPRFSQSGLPPFQHGYSSASASVCRNQEGRTGKVFPGHLWLRRPLSRPGNKERGLNDQINCSWSFILIQGQS
jgi:hypothetical protein